MFERELVGGVSNTSAEEADDDMNNTTDLLVYIQTIFEKKKRLIKLYESRLKNTSSTEELEKLINEILTVGIIVRDCRLKILEINQNLAGEMFDLREKYHQIADKATLKAYGGENKDLLMKNFKEKLDEAVYPGKVQQYASYMQVFLNDRRLVSRSQNLQLRQDIDTLRKEYEKEIQTAAQERLAELNQQTGSQS